MSRVLNMHVINETWITTIRAGNPTILCVKNGWLHVIQDEECSDPPEMVLWSFSGYGKVPVECLSGEYIGNFTGSWHSNTVHVFLIKKAAPNETS